MKLTEKVLEKILPSGSGFDYQWDVEEHKKNLVARSSYYLYNEYGFGLGPVDFSLVFPKDDPIRFKLMFHVNSRGRRAVHNHGLREYIDDTITYILSRFEETQDSGEWCGDDGK